MLRAEPRQIIAAHHAAVVVDQFADDANRRQAGQTAQIDRGLGVAVAFQHAAVARNQRKDVSGADKIRRGGVCLRQRPHATDPNKMLYDVWVFELVPQGEEWPERVKHRRFKHGDRSIGQVLDQDAYNLPTVQLGMKSDSFPGLWIGEQELRIRHFHKVLDDYIYGPGDKTPGDI